MGDRVGGTVKCFNNVKAFGHLSSRSTMSIPGKLLIAILSALLVSYLAAKLHPALPFVPLLLVSGASAIIAALLGHKPLSVPAALISSGDTKTATSSSERRKAERPARKKRAAASDSSTKPSSGPRETGTVKWFNGTKGFGFIVRDNGEEIFVHYRSILGEGRRSLEDGQAVEFRVEHTDKGPQAEDVEGLG
jgi:CspA family cold shock protein